MIILSDDIKKQLIDLYENKGVRIEGNIIKLLDTTDDPVFEEYISKCISEDKERQKKRLDITKQVQTQNNELNNLNEENQRILEELQQSLKDLEDQRMTLEVQNRELNEWKLDNLRLTEELQNEMVNSEKSRIEAEEAKRHAENDLDFLQKRNQTELISIIVRVALWVIIGVGFITTGVYIFTLCMGKDTQVISAAWSNMFGILLTNAFSIIGTIMGIKYATKDHS